jgi:L-iditol 2-dehydrogenase
VLGPGPIGQLVAQVAGAAGAQVVMAGIEADQAVRLAVAEQFGLPTINVERESVRDGLLRVSGRDRADLAFECAGASAALRDALQAVVKGGTIVLVALYGGSVETDFSWVVRREITLQATYAANWIDYQRSISFLRSGAVDDQADRAFKDALERLVMKPVLIP